VNPINIIPSVTILYDQSEFVEKEVQPEFLKLKFLGRLWFGTDEIMDK